MPRRHRRIVATPEGEAIVAKLDAMRFRTPWTGDPDRCARCNVPAILADTEGWQRPLCPDCWDDLGSPEREPGEA